MKISDIPKIELHVHLDGSVNLYLASKLLNKDLDEVKKMMVAPDKCNDLTDYLKMFDVPVSLMQTKENLKEIAYNLTLDLERDNVIYAEVRFAPLKHTLLGLTADEVILSVLEGLRLNKNIKTNLILCMMRNDSFEDNLKVIELAEKYKDMGVCAIDLAGDEINFKTSDFEDLFKIAYDKNINYTIHAGEAGSIDSLKSALSFKTKRIGHGIKAIDDTEVIDYIIKNNILLEVCPTSNYQTLKSLKYSEHPLYTLYKNGVNVLVNTDNRTVSNISLNEEYEKLIHDFNFSIDDFIKMNLNAINFLFINEEEKKDIRDKYNKLINGGV